MLRALKRRYGPGLLVIIGLLINGIKVSHGKEKKGEISMWIKYKDNDPVNMDLIVSFFCMKDSNKIRFMSDGNYDSDFFWNLENKKEQKKVFEFLLSFLNIQDLTEVVK